MKKNRQLKAKWVAEQFLEVFKTRPHWPAKEIVDCIKSAYKIIMTRVFAYKVKYAAHKLLHGSMHEHYTKVGGYLAALNKTSPGSHTELVTVMQKIPPPIFQRLFMCLEGLAKGWIEGCRKVLAVDACFLKTFLGGQLLYAVGRDANDQMYPVAWAIVEGENNLSWECFYLVLLNHVVNFPENLLSLVLQGHIECCLHVLPKAEHRHCARHVFAHRHKTYRGDELKLQFWRIAKSYNIADYEERLQELAVINNDAAEAFKRYNPYLFCRAYLRNSIKTDAITSNIAETFNGYIIQARTKHLLHCLEDIRAMLMQRIVKKRSEMMKCTTALCPRIQSKLNKEKNKSAYCEVFPSSETLFNVSHNMDQVVVNLETRSCSCRKWDMLGIPCCHACACIFFLMKEAEHYVDPCYTRENYLKAYAGSIPPSTLHNKRKCPHKDTAEAPPEPPTKKPRGRPNKYCQPSQTSVADAQVAPPHHHISAQPTQLGRGGRAIRGRVGARGGQQPQTGRGQSQTSAAATSQAVGLSQSTVRRGGRAGGRRQTMGGRGSWRGHTRGGKGRGRAPIGVGVLFGADGSVLPNVRGKSSKELSGTTITMKTRAASSQQAYNVMTRDSLSHKTTKHHQTQ
ncbi:uncharacterized protein LOC110698475 [Chenopodium quinoa]|uniref:uncharacterized protein LOC110698475 n=1 Tax=Chenopodium quinoa TaxID=63459 RepID=UPI000B788235|nr:uncharacterized protein LOC110698475 [Chenopodium quinoa]